MVLNTLEMPLVDEDDDLLSGALINLSEEILITLVNKNFLQSGEEDLCALNVPVDQVLIKALLCEGLWVSLSNLLAGGSELLSVKALSVHKALEEVVRHVHTSFVVETISGLRVELSSEELDVSSNILSCLTSVFDFEAGEPELEIKAKAIVEFEGGPVGCISSEEDKLSYTPVVFEPMLSSLAQVLLISVKLLLRVNVLKKLCLVPPAIIK